MQQEQEGLRREIGVLGLSANIINIVVGAGIFVLPAIVAAGLGSAGILAYLVCGFLIIMIMLCFAEVGSKVTKSGGSYAYIETAFGKYPGFLTANLFVFSAVTSDAAVANALADTLGFIFPVFNNALFKSGCIVLIFSGLIFINVRGVKNGINMVKFTVFAKLIPLLLLVLIGWIDISWENLEITSMPSARTLGEVTLILFFAFQGGETGLNISGEIKNPNRTVPRGILLGISIVLLLYILIQITAQGVLGTSLADFKEAPLAEVGRVVFGPFGLTLIVIGGAISMFGNLTGEILNIPRIIFRASKDETMPPKILSMVHPKYRTPYIAIIVYGSMSCILALLGEFEQLAILSSASILLIYLGVTFSLVKLRRDDKEGSDSFKAPGGYIVPVIAIITIVWLLSNLSTTEQIGITIFMAILSGIYYMMHLLKSNKKTD
ncbi:MAG: amino acid permease [Bacteroidetes bacterium]|nr:MAG: amino acid permease [Bacteroidota bacterium]